MTEQAVASWEGISAAALQERWNVPALHLFASVGSTNDVARSLALSGAAPGTLVLAEQQTAGRGRAGRGWSSPAGLGLWLSMVARPPEDGGVGALPLLVGLAAARALDAFVRPAAVQIKWPNDLLATGRKLGGILCEGTWEGAALTSVVVGLGLNVGHAPDDFPEEIRHRATSVRIAGGWTPDRSELADAVIAQLKGAFEPPVALTPPLLEELEERDALRGRLVEVTEPATGAPLTSGTALGIAPDGALLLRTPSGVLRTVRSGTVRPVDERE